MTLFLTLAITQSKRRGAAGDFSETVNFVYRAGAMQRAPRSQSMLEELALTLFVPYEIAVFVAGLSLDFYLPDYTGELFHPESSPSYYWLYLTLQVRGARDGLSIPKIPFSFFCWILGPGHLWGLGVGWGGGGGNRALWREGV